MKLLNSLLVMFLLNACGGVDHDAQAEKGTAQDVFCSQEQETLITKSNDVLALNLFELEQTYRAKLRKAVSDLDPYETNFADGEITLAQKFLDTVWESDSLSNFNCKQQRSGYNFSGANQAKQLQSIKKELTVLAYIAEQTKNQVAKTIEAGMRRIPDIATRNRITVAEAKEIFAKQILLTYSL